MRHSDPLLPSVYLVHPLDKKIPSFPIFIEVRHVRHQPEQHFPRCKMVDPLRRGDMLGSITPKELIESKPTIPTAKTTLQDYSSYKYSPSVRSYLADGQT